ncbi:phosphatase PAP2 family protein [Virgibacillus sp. W0430]|uniref:phosphatase PAP2 family protein n=1 Tax=Virgibacillus sp. W0430 TaxID=3391580 RepID=UPI003F48E08E
MGLQKGNKRFLLISSVFMFLFFIVVLLTSGMNGFLIDETISYWMTYKSTPFVTKMMHYISLIGSSEVILVFTIVVGMIFLWRRNWRHFSFFLTLSVGGVVLNFLLKMVISRERPGEAARYIEVFNMPFEIQSYSFPSGHTMRASILFLFLIYLSIVSIKNSTFKIGACVLLITLLLVVAVSRVYLDAHFATDVIGAIIISIAWFFLCFYFFNVLEQKR